jgi:hypothetical protein
MNGFPNNSNHPQIRSAHNAATRQIWRDTSEMVAGQGKMRWCGTEPITDTAGFPPAAEPEPRQSPFTRRQRIDRSREQLDQKSKTPCVQVSLARPLQRELAALSRTTQLRASQHHQTTLKPGQPRTMIYAAKESTSPRPSASEPALQVRGPRQREFPRTSRRSGTPVES